MPAVDSLILVRCQHDDCNTVETTVYLEHAPGTTQYEAIADALEQAADEHEHETDHEVDVTTLEGPRVEIRERYVDETGDQEAFA